MRKIRAMTDMRRTPAEKTDAVPTPAEGQDYPWGLQIALTQDELDKLGLTDEVEIGDMLHLHCMAKVTSVHKSASEASGKNCRVELQITHMTGEDEDSENEAATPADRRKRLYGT